MSVHRRIGKKDPSFSIYEFRSWLDKQPKPELGCPSLQKDKGLNEHIVSMGSQKKIESRLGIERLEEQVVKHNPKMDRATAIGLAQYFKENGGTLGGEHENMLVSVRTNRGDFRLPKLYTKPANEL